MALPFLPSHRGSPSYTEKNHHREDYSMKKRIGPKPRPLAERFAEKYIPEPNSGCWLWDGATTGRMGYGTIRTGSLCDGTRRNEGAHRVSYELHVGPIPEGLHVLHRCDVPACVNPDHLFLGTPADNTADMMAKGRQRKGESENRSKLTEADVREIRRRSESGEEGRALAPEFGVCEGTISMVINRKTWTHLL